jgi:hypothetical protein
MNSIPNQEVFIQWKVMREMFGGSEANEVSMPRRKTDIVNGRRITRGTRYSITFREIL